MIETELDAAQDGLLAAFTGLLRDPAFYELVGQLATVYGVTVRKVSAIDPRSFRTAKEALARFLARTSGYQARVSRATRNGSWRRGEVHPLQPVQGRSDEGAVERLGGRGSGVRSGLRGALEAAAASEGLAPPQYGPPVRRPSMKSGCPSCGQPAKHVWMIRTALHTGLVCANCVRERTKGWKREQVPSKVEVQE